MAGLISENILEEILGRIDIVEIISGYIPLKKAGRNFKACCPFHHEKTASFMVSPERQIYHCFGCHESGNAFKFLMRYERLEFPEAVEMLAKKAGVLLPEKQNNQEAGLFTQLYKINELAANYYHQYLLSAQGLPARSYLESRGLDDACIKLFKIGLSPDKWDGLTTYLRSKNINLSLIEKAGLVLAKEKGGYYDRFRNRIMFPISDIRSRVSGFGARLLSGSEAQDSAKYINSPETLLYTKGKNLYGLNLSKDAIRDNDRVIIVEGYLDFISPFSCGIKNIVASLGTALTNEQVSLLKRYTSNVVMIYDGDDAGQMATLRTLDIFIEEGMNAKIVTLPDKADPDSYVRKFGPEEFMKMIDAASSLFDFKFNFLKHRYDTKEIESKAKISKEMLLTINKFNDAVTKSEYIKRLSEQLSVNEDALQVELAKLNAVKNQKKPASVTVNSATPAIDPSERLLVKLLLEESELINHIRDKLGPDEFQDKRISKIVSLMFKLVNDGKEIGANKIAAYLNDDNAFQFICESVFKLDAPIEDKEKVADDCIKLIKKKKMTSLRQKLEEKIRLAEKENNEETLKNLRAEFCELIKKDR